MILGSWMLLKSSKAETIANNENRDIFKINPLELELIIIL